MKRTAESTIKGFLYQFHKTAKEILAADYDSVITAEGILEDVDIHHSDGTFTAIQCKYHEAMSSYTPSLIYKPLLLMAINELENPGKKIHYILFLHTQGAMENPRKIKREEFDSAYNSKQEEIAKLSSRIPCSFGIDDFLNKTTLEFASSFDEISEEVKKLLTNLNIKYSDVDNILYPNIINHIALLSSNKDITKRKITKKKLVHILSVVNGTAISKWTLAMKDRSQFLKSKKNQLLPKLQLNSRSRCFFIRKQNINDFDENIILFISNFISKYHCKPTHLKPPIFIIDCDTRYIKELQYRLYQKDLKCNTGFIGDIFDKNELYREPISPHAKATVSSREFHVRLIAFQDYPDVINHKKNDDVFFISDSIPENIDCRDVEFNIIGTSCREELEYILSMRNNYE